MFPVTLQIPVAVLLLLGGLVACFAGYRLFRIVLGIYGFILGALLASTMVGAAGMGPEPLDLGGAIDEKEEERVLKRFEEIGLKLMNRTGVPLRSSASPDIATIMPGHTNGQCVNMKSITVTRPSRSLSVTGLPS